MSKSLFKVLETKMRSKPDHVLFRIKRGLRQTVWTNEQVLRDVAKGQQFLKSKGIEVGDKVLIWAPNMPEWGIFFLSCIASGVTIVPVDVRSHADTVENYIKEVKPKLVMTSKFIFSDLGKSKVEVCHLEDIFSSFEDQTSRIQILSNKNQLVEILFTSGTSSNPKGVVISEKNILAQLEQTELLIPALPRYETVSILPLSHIYEQMYGFFLPIYRFGTVNYLTRVNPLSIRKSLHAYKATYLMVVPEFLRLLWEDIVFGAEKVGKVKQLESTLNVAKYLPKIVQRNIFKQIHKSFGGELSLITCGGAALENKLAETFESLGFKVIEGYGSTETVGIVACTKFNDRVLGTVGKPTKNVLIKLGRDNEILVSGQVVSKQYFNQTVATKNAYQNGWYKTGDTGRFDKSGNLIITGRISSRIVLDDGTKVYPEDIERHLNNQKEVKDSCIVEKKTPSGTLVHAFILPKGNLSEKQLTKLIAKVNQRLESKQQISSFSIWPGEKFPRTRTLKVDRKKVASQLVPEIASENIVAEETYGLSSVAEIIGTVTKRKDINLTDRLGDDLGLDSLRRIQLVAMLEEYLGIVIDELDITAQTTVSELLEAIKHKPKSELALADHFLERRYLSLPACEIRAILQKILFAPILGGYIKFKVIKGQEVMKALPQQALYIFNHIGMFDAVAVTMRLPYKVRRRLVIPVTSERWTDGNKVTERTIEILMGGYPFARQGKNVTAGLELTGDLADKGFSVILAPEGSMERNFKMIPFKPGTGYLARQLNLPIVMIKLGDEFRKILPPPPEGIIATDSHYYLPKKSGIVDIKVGYAFVDPKLSDDELTRDIQRQFKLL